MTLRIWTIGHGREAGNRMKGKSTPCELRCGVFHQQYNKCKKYNDRGGIFENWVAEKLSMETNASESGDGNLKKGRRLGPC